MNEHVVLLSVPGLRRRDLSSLPTLAALAGRGGDVDLAPSFPAVTCPVQANMTTGELPSAHGVIANGFYWRDRREVEMWTAWNDCILRPQIWDVLHENDAALSSAVWFPLHSKGAGADWICTPAPIHNPDGSESLWCYAKPTELYGELRDALGHFPLQHFWGPLANVKSTEWICRSALMAAERFAPNFLYVYLPHLDYAAQKHGPDSPAALAALGELDALLAMLVGGVERAWADHPPLWLVASEYAIVPVRHVLFPNRLLRKAGLLAVRDDGAGELLDLAGSRAWALVDHQFSHVYISDSADIGRVVDLFRGQTGVDEVLVGDERARYGLDHERSGEAIVVSSPDSWQAYYYWLDDGRAPPFARTVDIHRKIGYDPVELFFDPVARGVPLDAGLVRGSHGAPPRDEVQRGILVASERGVLTGSVLCDTDVFDLVLRQFGL